MVDNKEIITKFYELHQRPIDIASELKVKPSYITKIIQKDTRYISEKEDRQNISKEKRKSDKNDWIKKKRKSEENRQLDEYVKLQHIQASKDLSYVPEISDIAFTKWNRQMFTYDKKSSDLVLKRNITVACDVPKRVINVVNSSSIKGKGIYV